MAKVKTPLLSFGASGKIADSMVFFPWKGLNVVRQYVIPTNPKTDFQNTQRGYLKEVVPLLHAQMIDESDPFTGDDQSAYLGLASLASTPRTWFNALCGTWLLASSKGHLPVFYASQLATPAAGKVTITAQMVKTALGAFPTKANIRWGVKKTLMLGVLDAGTVTAGAISCDVTVATEGLVADTQYWFQIRAVEDAEETEAVSGLLRAAPSPSS